MEDREELPRWLWLWAPPLMLVAIVVGRLLESDPTWAWFNRKEGPIEWATALVLVPGVVAGVAAFQHRSRLPSPWLVRWLVVATAGAAYFGLEEISWGQQIWHWDTPAFLQDVNEQAETNLHNTTSLLNEKPKLALELFALFGGIIVPLVYRPRWPRATGDWRPWFWPTRVCLPAAILAVGIYIPDRIEKFVDGFSMSRDVGLRLSEPQEYYLAVFLTIYLLSLAARLRAAAPAP